ncbi:MAG TPA: prolyl oligopeptidase family serine peptidase [Gemmatimonadaceae bacterium]|nr:prolyl oligopeptidase family serine peptidase [Gemmatimonadaceae bacterium]
MLALARRYTSLAALALLAACVIGDNTSKESSGAVERTFTPTQYSVEDLYKNTEFFGASWSPDRQKILVSSNLSGIYNAYAIPAAGGELQPLTSSTTNSVFALSYFPNDERILYSSDQGGNELTHIYVRNMDGTTQDLTPGAKVKANFRGWAHNDSSFFIGTNERDPRFFDLYEIAIDGYRRTLLYRNTEGFELGPVSRDKRYVALVKLRTTSDADIYLHDRQSNTTTNITQHTGVVNNSPETFTPDGSKLLYVSDEGREFASLRSYDLASGAKAPVYEQSWDVIGASYSKGGKYLTVSVNEDSRIMARVLDAAALTPVQMEGMPNGLVRGMSITRNDSAVAFYSTDGSVPDDLYAGAIGSPPRRLTSALNPRIRREDLVVPTVVRFKAPDGVDIPGVLYKPHQASDEAKAPAMVMVHGGPGGQAQVDYRALTQALANRGYVVLDINNRGSSGYGKTFYAMDDKKHGEADLADVVASKRMLIETGYVDSTRIGIIGGSYGGYMVLAALTLQPDAFKVGVDLFGISNWVRTLTSIPPWWASFREALYAELGDPKTDSARLHRISPLFNAEKIKVPLLVLQGANDPRVLKVESDEIVEAAKKNGVPVEYVVFEDEGHGFVKKENEIRGYTAVLAFLDKHLKGETAVAGRER